MARQKGEGTWMLPSLSDRIDKEQQEMKRMKKKKRRRKRKRKTRRKRKRRKKDTAAVTALPVQKR